jgi:hypothetical protein
LDNQIKQEIRGRLLRNGRIKYGYSSTNVEQSLADIPILLREIERLEDCLKPFDELLDFAEKVACRCFKDEEDCIGYAIDLINRVNETEGDMK